MDYELGRKLDIMMAQNNQIIEMLKTVGDMVYSGTPKIKKKNNKKEQEENEEPIDETTDEDTENTIRNLH